MTGAPALWTKHRSIAYGIAREYRWPGADREDVRQEALIALWVAARTHDPAKGTFPAWARRCVRAAPTDRVRVATKRGQAPTVCELEDVHAAPEQLSLTPLLEAHRCLTDRERAAVRDHLNGVPARSSKQHENALYLARRKLKAAA